MVQPIIVLAGAAGDLGGRIAKALAARGAAVRALVRHEVSAADKDRLVGAGAVVTPADASDIGSVAAACAGAACVVSALNGLHEVIVDRQGVLLDAAVKAGVPRFVSSDYSADFTKTRPGDNRNLDLRRKFMTQADRAPIKVTSILNGAFMDMLGVEMPIIQRRLRRVLHWGSVDQPLDFTTKDEVAAYAAAVALDEATPRILRVAGDTVSARDIARAMSEVTGDQYRTLWVGSIGSLGMLIRLARVVAPQPRAAFPPWQGMQYMRDMFSGRGKLHPLDNDRYPGLRWTSVHAQLGKRGE
ncbi:NmrA family NAD(P)-binding protein [Rhodopila sp.]|uniref:NmrA family NAD(P)-binding protein n=1 Tax=Rhodopila sp. TaxID=2480087 RepID=UPI003D0F7C95